jgi:hypothetical protein
VSASSANGTAHETITGRVDAKVNPDDGAVGADPRRGAAGRSHHRRRRHRIRGKAGAEGVAVFDRGE